MARIVARVDDILKLAIDRDINPNAHAIANAAGVTYELMRRTLNGETPSEKTMATLMTFFDAQWDELFYLESTEPSGH